MSILWFAWIFALGMASGWVLSESWRRSKPKPKVHEQGLYANPGLSRLFWLRDQETDPDLKSMSLRDYKRYKAGLTAGLCRPRNP